MNAFRAALLIARKDLRLVLTRGAGLAQALLLGLLLVFVFSLSREAGQAVSGQAAATVFWLASTFSQVLVFSMIYGLEEANGARAGLVLAPVPAQSIWIGKALAGLVMILLAQALFWPAAVVFLGQGVTGNAGQALLVVLLADVGLACLGSLLGALSQGQAARESLLSIVLFPLVIPLLLAGIRACALAFGEGNSGDIASWIGLVAAFDAVFLAAGLVLFPFVFSGED